MPWVSLGSAAKLTPFLLAAGLWLGTGIAPLTAQAECAAPAPVCAARAAVFPISSFDPAGSAVRIAPDLLVTNRHVTADRRAAEIFLPDGRTVEAEVMPTGYPGDLVLLRSAELAPGPALAASNGSSGASLFSVAARPGDRQVRVYAPGALLFAPAEGKPLARLHNTAAGEPGNSGGALVDESGALVGIVTSGGEGRNEAIPAAEIERLRTLSGPRQAAADARLGEAYRLCLERLEARRVRPGPLADPEARRLIDACGDSGNRQLFDLAAQLLGQARRYGQSASLFRRALEQDPNALNSRIGLLVTLHLDRRFADELPHLHWLLEVLPDDAQVLRFAVQAGKWADDPELAERALTLLETYHPQAAPAARGFYEADAPAPSRTLQ